MKEKKRRENETERGREEKESRRMSYVGRGKG